MIEQIKCCRKCGLCLNQQPLLDEECKCQVIWVGLSAKMITCDGEKPLSSHTNSGMLISQIEAALDDVTTYKTNLVKCVPLEGKKLRYPNAKEIDCCFHNLKKEIRELSPRIVFLLGEKVYTSVGKHMNIQFKKWNEFDYQYLEHDGVYYIPVHHPSYISVYKRKQAELYVHSIEGLARKLLQQQVTCN